MALPLPQSASAALVLALWAGPAIGQVAPSPGMGRTGTVPPIGTGISPECHVPSSTLYVTGRLPTLASALEKGRPIRVLALGPFPSGGFGSTPGAPKYTAQLQVDLQRVLAGAAVEVEGRRLPGEITAGAPEYVTNTVMDVRPNLVIWSAGTHDALARADIESFASAVGEILGWLKSEQIDVVVVEPAYAAAVEADEHYLALVKRLRAVAREHEAPLVLRFEAMRHLARQQTSAAERHFRLHDLSRRCTPEYVAQVIAATLLQRPRG